MTPEPEPRFLALETVGRLHRRSLELFGGLDGVRDPGAIESAIASAQNTWTYGGGDVYAAAAAHAFHVAEAQAYLDANERTAAACAIVFIVTNGVEVPPDQGQLYAATIALARRELDSPGLAALLRRQFPHA